VFALTLTFSGDEAAIRIYEVALPRTEEERASAVRDLWLGQSVSQSPEAAYSEGVDEGRVGMRRAKAGEESEWNARSITHCC
jgi:hypothetical protein